MKLIAYFTGSLILLSLSFGTPQSRAQERVERAETICMSAVAKAGRRGATFTIFVPQARASILEERGFAIVPCRGESETLPEFRNAICELSRTAPQAAKDNLAAMYGVGPDELCEMMKEL
jgi:hypothetical protein